MENNSPYTEPFEHKSFDPRVEEAAILAEAATVTLPEEWIDRREYAHATKWWKFRAAMDGRDGFDEYLKSENDPAALAALVLEQELLRKRVVASDEIPLDFGVPELSRALAIDRILRRNNSTRFLPGDYFTAAERYDIARRVAGSDPSGVEDAASVYLQSEHALLEQMHDASEGGAHKGRMGIRNEIVGTANEALGYKLIGGSSSVSLKTVLAWRKSQELWGGHMRGEAENAPADQLFAARVVLELTKDTKPTAATFNEAMDFFRARHVDAKDDPKLTNVTESDQGLLDEVTAFLEAELPEYLQTATFTKRNELLSFSHATFKGQLLRRLNDVSEVLGWARNLHDYLTAPPAANAKGRYANVPSLPDVELKKLVHAANNLTMQANKELAEDEKIDTPSIEPHELTDVYYVRCAQRIEEIVDWNLRRRARSSPGLLDKFEPGHKRLTALLDLQERYMYAVYNAQQAQGLGRTALRPEQE